MKKGKLLGCGATAEVYEWGPDKILKLYFDKYSEEWVNNEAKVGHIVNQSGINSPIVYEEVKVGSRLGVIYQRIYGKTITEHLITEPWKLYYYIHQMAVLQNSIHNFSVNGLPTQKLRFTFSIRLSSYLLGYKVKRILEYMESLPDGESICHGDLYFNNIIVLGNTLVPIDWNSTYTGNRLGDVARTCMIMCSPAMINGIHDTVAMLSYYSKRLAYWAYISEYMRLAKVKFEDIDAWTLPVAAAKLKDNIPGERKWLMSIIDKRLELLN